MQNVHVEQKCTYLHARMYIYFIFCIFRLEILDYVILYSMLNQMVAKN